MCNVYLDNLNFGAKSVPPTVLFSSAIPISDIHVASGKIVNNIPSRVSVPSLTKNFSKLE